MPAEPLDRGRDGGVDGGLVAHVEGLGEGLAAERGRERLRLVGRDVGHDDMRALRRVGPHDRRADPLRAAGHDRDLVLEPHGAPSR